MNPKRELTPKRSLDELIKGIFRRIASKLDHPVSLLALKDHKAQLSHKFDFDYLNCQNINKLKQLAHLALKELELLADNKIIAESPVCNLYEEFSEHVNQRFIDLKAKNIEIAAQAKYYKTYIKSFRPVFEKIKNAADAKTTKASPDFNCDIISPKVC